MALKLKRIYNVDKTSWQIDISGEVDIQSSDNLKEFLNKVIEEKMADIYLNCDNLLYIDSTGLGVLIGVSKKLKEKELKIYILKPRKNISKLLNITGLNRLFIVE